MNLKAFKMDGLGNDFLIIDRRKNHVSLNKEKIIELGRRDKIGFDQILFIEKETKESTPITIFNSDGNEVSACGNGSRCVAYILSKERNTEKISLKTNERILHTEIVGNLSVKINMGKPIFDWQKIPISKEIDYKNINLNFETNKFEFKNGFALNMGNPHIVFFRKNCFDYNLEELGPAIENHNLFPEKCNVTLAQIIDRGNILVNVWERGSGLTKACGTAACATVVAGYLKGLVERKSNIKFKEGILNLHFSEEENVYMTGPVSEIKEINVKI